MTAVPIFVKLTEDLPFDETARNMTKWKRAAFKAMGDFWHKKLLPKHFTQRAKTTYGHRKRTTKYTDQKWAHAQSGRKWKRTGETVKQGGRVDNVLTGTLRARLESPAFTTIKAYPSRVTIMMLSVVYAPQKQRSPKQPPIIKEIFTNTAAELQQLGKIWFDEVMRQWNAFTKRKVTKPK